MQRRRTPATLLDQQASVLRTQLHGVYDGHVDAVHDARVATRRIRELLALVPTPGGDGEEDVATSYRKAGRALGRVRDIDVQIGLIQNLETHTPQAAPSLVIVRQDHERRRLAKMRRAIKTLEGLNIDGLLHAVGASHPAALRTRLTSTGWKDQLARLVCERARRAHEATEHATGVYFPNRAHGARIAMKQLRYASEIAGATGLCECQVPIKTLKRGQEILGDLHDRQALFEALGEYKKEKGVDVDHLQMIRQVLESEVRELHARYLQHRESLRQSYGELLGIDAPSLVPRAAVALSGALAASAGLYYMRGKLAGARDVRVSPVPVTRSEPRADPVPMAARHVR